MVITLMRLEDHLRVITTDVFKLFFWICGLYALRTEDAKLVVDSYAQKLYPNFSSEVQKIPILNLSSPRSHLSPINSVEGDRSHNGSMNNIDS